MSTTYPLSTLAPTVSSAGISAPTYDDIWQSFQAIFKGIYGDDAYISADTKDGQLLAAFCQAIHNSNQAAVAIFNSFSPTYATGVGLSSRIKLNGLTRNVASYSTATVKLTGTVGREIINGVARDTAGYLWDLPASVTIGSDGTVETIATCETEGAISAAASAISTIYTPQYGWSSITNELAAEVGDAVESDAEVRVRQGKSTSLPSQSILEGIYSGLGNLPGVTRCQVYENDTEASDINGLPAHSISAVVEGGTEADIAKLIVLKKTAGATTYGTTEVDYIDARGLQQVVKYFKLAQTQIYISITLKAISGFASSTINTVQQKLVDYVNSLNIGEDVYYNYAMGVASLAGTDEGRTFYIQSLTVGEAANPTGTANITIPFNYAATAIAANVIVTVV